MIRKSFGQTGFGVAGFLVAVAVVGLIAFLGWNLWQQSKTAEDADKSTQTPAQSDTARPHLLIEEWGVNLPLSEGVTEAYYEEPGTGVGGFGESVGVYDKSFDGVTNSIGRSCTESQTGGREAPLLALSRIKTSDAPKIQQITDEFDRTFFTNQLKEGKELGEYTYFVTSMHQSYPFCVFVDEENTEQDQSIIKTWEDKKTALNEAVARLAQQ